MSIQAYKTAAQRSEDPRQTEYRLMGQVTRALMDAQSAGRRDLKGLTAALDWNRRVWTAFAADCAGKGNNLPESLRANIISLSIFVTRYSSDVLRNGADIEALIDINKSIMQGLEAGQRAAAAQAAQSAAQPAPAQ